jgi:Spy/CpxP family protein refolding chaperone
MYRTIILVCGLCLITVGAGPATQPRGSDATDVHMLSVGLILQHQEEIGLTPEQREKITTDIQQVGAHFADLQQTLQHEVTALNEIMGQVHPDEAKAQAQLDKVLDVEREIKKARLSVALAIKDTLTSEQQAKLTGIMQTAADHGSQPPTLHVKLQQAKDLLRRAQDEGRDLSEVNKKMLEIQPLMEQGKFKEAEQAVDQVIQLLAEPEKK